MSARSQPLPSPFRWAAPGDVLSAALLHPAFLPACFLLFMGLRIALVALVPVEPSSDFLWYHNRAAGLARGEGYSEQGVPTAFWPVGWPAVAGALYYLFGTDTFVVQVANLVFAAATFFVVLALARTLFGSEPAARIAVLLLAVYPNNIAYTALTSTETFYTLLLLAGTWIFISRRSFFGAVVCGLVFGYATLTKPQTLLMPLILVGIGFLFEPGRRLTVRTLVHGAVVFLAMALVLGPWAYRNYRVLGEPVFVSTNGGWAFYVGNNPSALASRGFPTDGGKEVLDLWAKTFTVEKQIESGRRAKAAAVEWIRENPGTFALLMPLKAFSLWSVDGEGEWAYQRGTPWYDEAVHAFRTVRILNQAYYGLLMLGFAAAGVVLLRRFLRHRSLGEVPVWALTCYAFAGYTTLQCMIMAGSYRYKFPLMPFVIIACAWVVSVYLQRGRTALPASSGQTSTGGQAEHG